jgi:excisionase family DNA binding protein
MKIIGTTEAGRRLGISDARVRALIMSKRLKAVKVGGAWLIDPKDLDAVKNRKVGRPKSRNTKRKPKSKSGDSR